MQGRRVYAIAFAILIIQRTPSFRRSYKMPAFSASFDIILFAVVPKHDHVSNRLVMCMTRYGHRSTFYDFKLVSSLIQFSNLERYQKFISSLKHSSISYTA